MCSSDLEKLKKGDDFRFIAEDGLRAASHHEGRLTDRIDLHEWITMSLQRATEAVNGKLSNGLAFLATVSSTSPYVGLFGTVWGIMSAFYSLGNVQSATIAVVAPHISEALIATAMGLFAAIPAGIFFNRYADQVGRLEVRYDTFMEELSAIFQRNAARRDFATHDVGSSERVAAAGVEQ